MDSLVGAAACWIRSTALKCLQGCLCASVGLAGQCFLASEPVGEGLHRFGSRDELAGVFGCRGRDRKPGVQMHE